jgi:hypothetical protein
VEPHFRVQDLATLLGINPRRVEGWVEQGFLKPATVGKGPGRRNEFDLQNLVQAAVMLELKGVVGDKSRYPKLVALGARPIAEVEARRLAKDSVESDRVLLVAHTAETGPYVFKCDSLPRLQPFIARALSSGSTITLVSMAGVLAKLRQSLQEWYEKSREVS